MDKLGLIPEKLIPIPVVERRGPASEVRTRLSGGCAPDRYAPAPAPPKTGESVIGPNTAVRYLKPAPPGEEVISTVPENCCWMFPKMSVVAAPILVTPTKVSKAGMANPGVPIKFEIVTGMDTPPPLALPAVDSVVVPEPVSVAVTMSAGSVWAYCRTVPAFVEELSRSNAAQANAQERRKNRTETVSW